MTPERGDIIHLKFDPSTGQEMRGDHFALVVSPKAFNAKLGLAMVCPISGGKANPARHGGFLVTLMGSGCRTDGTIHVHQLKALDYKARKAAKVETIPKAILDEVLSVLMAVFEDSD